jgi:hypothetical protein
LHDLASLRNANSINPEKTKVAAKQAKRTETKDIVSGINSIVTGNTSNEDINDDNNPAGIIPLLSVIKNSEPSSNTNTQTGLTIAETKSNNVADVVLKNKNENPTHSKIENIVTTAPHQDPLVRSSGEELNEITADKEETVNNTLLNKKIISPAKDITTPDNASSHTTSSISKPRKINTVTWTYYISPSIGYRTLSDNKINHSVIHDPMLGYEGGTAMSFKIYKKLQFTSGLQLNYSGYNIKANNTHPIVATLVLNTETVGQYEVYSAMSHYGNRTGTEFTKLKNYSLQVSLPIGLQYELPLNDNVRLGTAATFQPTYIIASQAYLLSEDKRNYLTNHDLFRKWNMNSNLTTYVSFSSSSFNWQIGPQVRYQLLSTYTNRYQLKENLINYGIRVGISKISK